MSRRAHLEGLLNDLVVESQDQATFREQMKVLLREGDVAFDRGHIDPGHFTASAFVLDPSREALLLILHKKLGLWLQPGGHVDPDDADIIAAAKREVQEETGIASVELAAPGIFDVDVHQIPRIKGTPAHRHFDVRFLFVSDTRVHEAATDAEKAQWVNLDAVGDIQSDRSVMRAVEQIREM